MSNINEQALLAQNKQLKEQLNEAVRLLTACSTQVGTMLGEEISMFKASTTGIKHNAAEWDLSDKNGEQ